MYSGDDAAGYTSNNMLLKSWFGIGFYCTLTDANQKETGLTGYINTRSGRLEMKEQIIPGNYTNFDARYQLKTTCPFPVGAILTMGNGTNPATIYAGTTWKDLSASYSGRVMQIGATALATGGNNSVKLAANNLPPHAHRGGPGAGGSKVADFNIGTDNQGNYTAQRTSGTYVDSASGAAVTNAAFSVQNAFVSVKAWMRTA